jgi:hypothetical protein
LKFGWRSGNAARIAALSARVEHVFGDQKNGMGAELVRTIGIVRARCKIGMTNLVYRRHAPTWETGGDFRQR